MVAGARSFGPLQYFKGNERPLSVFIPRLLDDVSCTSAHHYCRLIVRSNQNAIRFAWQTIYSTSLGGFVGHRTCGRKQHITQNMIGCAADSIAADVHFSAYITSSTSSRLSAGLRNQATLTISVVDVRCDQTTTDRLLDGGQNHILPSSSPAANGTFTMKSARKEGKSYRQGTWHY